MIVTALQWVIFLAGVFLSSDPVSTIFYLLVEKLAIKVWNSIRICRETAVIVEDGRPDRYAECGALFYAQGDQDSCPECR